MINRKDFMPLEFYKKEPFSGSEKGFRYRVEKVEDEFYAYYWPGPFCYEKTDEEGIVFEKFPFTLDGLDDLVKWLQESYSKDKDRYNVIPNC